VIREKSENDFQQKFEEKFVLRPQQLRAKVEREKNVLKKMENVLVRRLSKTTCPTTSCSARVWTRASLRRC
jgi:LPS O-antigen subunit length determinant protein (WzzB/FepE family)